MNGLSRTEQSKPRTFRQMKREDCDSRRVGLRVQCSVTLAIALLLTASNAGNGIAAAFDPIPAIRPANAEKDGSSMRPLALVGVHVLTFDTSSGARLASNQTVLVRDGRIVRVGNSSDVRVPRDMFRVHAFGKYLIPGLADMHVHLTSEPDLALFIANGITTIRIMGGSDFTRRLAEQIDRGEILGPSIHSSGPLIDGSPPVWPQATVLTDPEEADALLAEHARQGYDFAKIYVELSAEVYEAVVRTARKHGLRPVGHVPYSVPLGRALTSGQESIEHLDGYLEALQADDSPWLGQSNASVRLFGADHVDDSKIASVAAATAVAGVWNCPTLVVEEHWMTSEAARAQFERPELRYMRRRTVEWWKKHDGTNLNDEQNASVRKLFEVRKKLVLALHRAGAGLLAGSDAPNPLVLHGFALHEELELLEAAGLDRGEVLRIATENAGKFLRPETPQGRIEATHRADAVLLDRNPLDDLGHLRRPRGVLVNGAWYPSELVRQMLDSIESERKRRENW